ncbi:MAG: hypothetical protein LUM44_00285 [Pyrinomonadaceae bacterium]|nr:hypothetical protein [Pyrinomonadaceae bacterium]
MKRFWLKSLFLSLVLAVSSLTVLAQDSYRVGEKVEFECNCFGPTQWVKGTIEEDQGGNTYRVRFGNGRYDYQNGVGTTRIRKPGQTAKIANQNALRYQFLDEAAPYRESVFSLMMVHDENLRVGNNKYTPPVRAEDWKKTMSDLAALDNLCKTKYAGMTNDPNSVWKDDLGHLPATWCEIAARRAEYEQGARGLALSFQIGPTKQMYLSKMNEILNDSEPVLSDDYQLLVFEPAKWRVDFTNKSQTAQKGTGAKLPESFFRELEAKAAEVKEFIDQDAPGRTFKMPPYKDATVENFVRGRYATGLKGVQIIKMGMDYTTWKIWKNSLGIPTHQTKRGRALVKVPNRPFCQEQEFVVEKVYTGGGRYGTMKLQGNVGGAGMFMSCN